MTKIDTQWSTNIYTILKDEFVRIDFKKESLKMYFNNFHTLTETVYINRDIFIKKSLSLCEYFPFNRQTSEPLLGY